MKIHGIRVNLSLTWFDESRCGYLTRYTVRIKPFIHEQKYAF